MEVNVSLRENHEKINVYKGTEKVSHGNTTQLYMYTALCE